MHPLISTFMKHPDLLMEHLGAYSELAGTELEALARHYRRRGLLAATAMSLGVLALGFIGVAFMLWVVWGQALDASRIGLIFLPGVVSLGGVMVCLMGIHGARPLAPLAVLSEQLKADVRWCREQTGSST